VQTAGFPDLCRFRVVAGTSARAWGRPTWQGPSVWENAQQFHRDQADDRRGFMTVMDALGLMLLVALSERALYYIGLVVVLVSLVVTSILAYRVWCEMNEDIEPATTDELLAPFDEARAAGELDEAEYARLRQRIQEAQLPAPVARPDNGNRPKGPSALES
jgi:hypothetical protein